MLRNRFPGMRVRLSRVFLPALLRTTRFRLLPLPTLRMPGQRLFAPTAVTVVLGGAWCVFLLLSAESSVPGNEGSAIASLAVSEWILVALITASMAVAVSILLTYRGIAEDKFESIAVLLTLTALVQGVTMLFTTVVPRLLSVNGGAEPPDPNGLVARSTIGFVVVCFLLVVLTLVHLVAALVRRKKTQQRVDTVLRALARPCASRQTVEAFADLGKAFIQEDFLPKSFPQRVIDSKHEQRKQFLAALPSGDFDTCGVLPDDLLVVRGSRHTLSRSGSHLPDRTEDGTWHGAYSLLSMVIAVTSLTWMSFQAVVLVD